MKDAKEIETMLEQLARVRSGEPGGEASGAGARALLAEVTAAAPAAPKPGFPLKKTGLVLAGAAVVAAGALIVPSVLDDSGTYVSASYAVTKDSSGVVFVRVTDFKDVAGLTRQLADLGVPAVVDHVPEGMTCKEPRAEHVRDIPQGLYSVPQNLPGRSDGWQMRIDTRLFRAGEQFVWTISPHADGGSSTSTILMKGPVAPCELVPEPKPDPAAFGPEYRVATVEGRSLEGFRVDEKTVGQVLPEIRKRGLKPTFAIMSLPPGNPGGYGIVKEQSEPVGDDWVVWEAEELDEDPRSRIRLLVTEDRWDKNPVYGGPRDAVIKD
ncbi:hypothetical protein [Nonomuraea typhae]|uniref:DUF4179 domain-containing protein n=1 Tax=Nonomuraea typhae TaxID=2603600 RepID=A0ABW7YN88_9ACTN